GRGWYRGGRRHFGQANRRVGGGWSSSGRGYRVCHDQGRELELHDCAADHNLSRRRDCRTPEVTMSIRKSWILGAAGAAGLFAQQGSLGGPVSGYVFDWQAQSLRIVRGIPGASVIGDGVDLGAGVMSAWVAPRQDAAVTVSAEGDVRPVRLPGGTVAGPPWGGLGAS